MKMLLMLLSLSNLPVPSYSRKKAEIRVGLVGLTADPLSIRTFHRSYVLLGAWAFLVVKK